MRLFICFFTFLALLIFAHAEGPIDPQRIANTVILDDNGVRNLGIETEEVEERDFETTVFAIGRLEEVPSQRSVLSSRISGRIVELEAFLGDVVEKDQVIARVESRQPGSPPPVIELRAPISGVITESHIRLGEPVEPNQELLDISDRSRMWAVAKIPEKEAASMRVGSKARLRIPALGNEEVEVTLERFGVLADKEAGTLDGIFVIDNTNGRMQPGMRGEFNIILSSREDVMAVPRRAVQGDPTKRVVFVKDFELPNAFVRVPVVLGERNDQYYEVISGLFPADEVVTQGSYGLSFAGAGSGMSLKEALDAAHGHEHNEDGSEMTAEQKAVREAEHSPENHSHGPSTLDWIIRIWAIIATLLFLICLQQILSRRRS